MAPTDIERMTAQRLKDAFGLTVEASFVPWTLSRSFDPEVGKDASRKSLNWRVTVRKDGREVLTTDYMAGIGHAPSVKNHDVRRDGSKWSTMHCEAVEVEVEQGFEAYRLGETLGCRPNKTKPILPDAADVLYCLASDGRAIEYPCFEDWACEYGLDPDSRKAEASYRACLDTGLRLRAALGEKYGDLIEAFAGY